MPSRRYRLRGSDKYLAPSEHILHTTRRHWIVIVKPLAIWILVLVLGGMIGVATSPEQAATPLDRLAGIAAVVATIYAAWRFVEWTAAAYVVTSARVLEVEGVLSRNVSAVPLSKVTDTTFRRTALGRLLRYGDLMLDSPGEKPGLSTLTTLPRPVELYRLIMSLVVTKEEGPDEAKAVPPPPPRHRPDEDETGPIERISV
jgi:uncharacterized membrane protein YdbT with pleckstrin-like domain